MLTIALGVVAYPVALSFFAPETSRRAFGLVKRVLGRKTATSARVALRLAVIRADQGERCQGLHSHRQTRSVARRVRMLLALLARSAWRWRCRVPVVAVAARCVNP